MQHKTSIFRDFGADYYQVPGSNIPWYQTSIVATHGSFTFESQFWYICHIFWCRCIQKVDPVQFNKINSKHGNLNFFMISEPIPTMLLVQMCLHIKSVCCSHMAHPGLSLICDRSALYFHPGIIKNRHMNNMRYGHYFTLKKKKDLAGNDLYLCKKAWGIQWCYSQSSTRVTFMNGPKKTSKNGHFWAFLGWHTHFLRK